MVGVSAEAAGRDTVTVAVIVATAAAAAVIVSAVRRRGRLVLSGCLRIRVMVVSSPSWL